MTSLSRRKRRTTAPRTTRPLTAAKIALLAVLAGGTAAAQQPGPFPDTGGARTVTWPGLPAAYQGGGIGAGTKPAAPAPAKAPATPPPATKAGDRAIPAGYRPVGSSSAPVAPADRVGTTGGTGRVMYFQKPADALTATTPGGEAVAAAADVPAAVPDGPTVPTVPAVVPPALPAAAPVATAPPVGYPAPGGSAPVRQDGQPVTSTSQRKQEDPKPKIDPAVYQLPPRQTVFTMPGDVELERTIVEAVRENLMKNQDPKLKIPPPTLEPFPSLERIYNELAPPGTVYTPKTVAYEPRKAVYEPHYVVHRRLHFEEKNTERYGWDFGILQPIVSTGYFYKDVLLWPNSLASGLEVGFWDTSAGKCLPGSPVPYYIYPPNITLTGLLFEGTIVTGTAFMLRPPSPPLLPAAGR